MEGAMRELARGDANESQAPRGCRHHLTAGAPLGGGGGEAAAGGNRARFLFILA